MSNLTNYTITIYTSPKNSISFQILLTPQQYQSFITDNSFTQCDYLNITVDSPTLISQNLTQPINPYHQIYNKPLPLNKFLQTYF